MQQVAAVRSVKQAVRMLKSMDVQAPEWGTLRSLSREAVRRVIEQRMQERVGNRLEALAANGLADRRNGSYRRGLLHELGALELRVPRTRTFSAAEVLGRYARRVPQLDRVILAGFLLGLSTRKVGEALLPILGERVSPATVSRVAQTLDEVVTAWHGRSLANRYRVLLFDGVVLARRTGAGALRRPVLVALGITLEGKKEILDFRLAPAESQPAWEAFLNELYARGLTGEGVTLIVTDGGAGLLAALPLSIRGSRWGAAGPTRPATCSTRCARSTASASSATCTGSAMPPIAPSPGAKPGAWSSAGATATPRRSVVSGRTSMRCLSSCGSPSTPGARRRGPPTPSNACSSRSADGRAPWGCSVTAPPWSASCSPSSAVRTRKPEPQPPSS